MGAAKHRCSGRRRTRTKIFISLMEKKNYLAEFELWLVRRLKQCMDDENVDAFVKDVSGKILESYRNGQRSRRSKNAASSGETK